MALPPLDNKSPHDWQVLLGMHVNVAVLCDVKLKLLQTNAIWMFSVFIPLTRHFVAP